MSVSGSHPDRRSGVRVRRTAFLVAALLGVGFVVAGIVVRRRSHPGSAPAAPVAPSPTAPPAVAPARQASEIRAALRRASAFVSCGLRGDRAVFVGAERAVAAFACDDAPQFRLADGRELLGKRVGGSPLGLSIFDVLGAAASPIPLGEAFALGEGADLLAAVEGRGEELGSVRSEGMGSARGLPVLRLGAAGRQIAGPVIDGAGRLVAIVPREPVDPSEPGLAIPAEAISAATPGARPTEAWLEAVRRAEAEDEASAKRFRSLYRTPELLAAWADGPKRIGVAVARRSGERPGPERVRGAVAPAPPGGPCVAEGAVVAWTRAGTAEPWLPRELAARFRWAAGRGVADDLWIGRGSLEIRCEPERVPDGARLSLAGAFDGRGSVPVPLAELRGAQPPVGQPPAPGADAGRDGDPGDADAREAEAAEASWRAAFRDVHARIRDAEDRRRGYGRAADEAESHSQYARAEQLRRAARTAAVEAREAEDELHELERRASLAAVPREWRRP